jgi:adenine-specific DNA-methyltransferase
MKTRSDVTADKLRGGYYSPDELVDRCLDRICELTAGNGQLRILEPSAGDGAFIRGLRRNRLLAQRTSRLDAIELIPAEAALCTAELERCGVVGTVRTGSAIPWASASNETYEVAVGNPPYVRFQFVPDSDRAALPSLEAKIGVSFGGVSNLWLPVLLGALDRLVTGGAFAFIIPAECFTGISAGVLRKWLVQNTRELRFDLFPPDSFPSVLQEVVILSGSRVERSDTPTECEIREHRVDATFSSAAHHVPPNAAPWTRYLLTKDGIDALEEASGLAEVWALGSIAKFEVAAVTGANDFFSVDEATLQEHDLAAWSTPLLPRLRHAEGLRYTVIDHRAAGDAGAKTHLLDFSSERPDPSGSHRAIAYLADGEKQGLPERYKCRIREPWYRVPFIRPGRLMMSKRSHHYPKVIVNDAGVVTTDTIYRGSMIGFFADREDDFAAAFHNSLTLLTAEVEGRSFGGGVLELVPSEVARLLVPLPIGFGVELERLDAVARADGAKGTGEALVHDTDQLLVKADIGFSTDLMERLHAARLSLLQRRLDRN